MFDVIWFADVYPLGRVRRLSLALYMQKELDIGMTRVILAA